MARRVEYVSTKALPVSSPTPFSKPGKYESFFSREMRDHLVQTFGGEDDALRSITRDAEAAGLPAISISPFDGQLLAWLIKLVGARHAVEIGTLGGYSTSWIARALPRDGRLDSFELEGPRAAFAREHVARAAPGANVEIHVGPALENLARIAGPVDFVFIDADKSNYPRYLDWATQHLRPGGLVALDNAFAWGGVVDPTILGDRAEDARAIQSCLERLAHDGSWHGMMLPTNEGLAVGLRR